MNNPQFKQGLGLRIFLSIITGVKPKANQKNNLQI